MENSFISNLINGHIFNYIDIFDFFPRFLINLIFVYIVAARIYYRRRHDRDYLFTMISFNLVIFIVCFLLASSELSIGFAFGLFAVFSILRYRTEAVPIKEMTYIFIAISGAVINALSTHNISIGALIFSDLAIIGSVIILEKVWVKNVHFKEVQYEKIELIKPENHHLLLEDLKNRTGLPIHRVEIDFINFLNDTAKIKVFYFEKSMDEQND